MSRVLEAGVEVGAVWKIAAMLCVHTPICVRIRRRIFWRVCQKQHDYH